MNARVSTLPSGITVHDFFEPPVFSLYTGVV